MSDPAIDSRICRFSQILTEDCDLLHTQVTEQCDTVILDGNDHAEFVTETTAAYDLDMVSLLETLSQPFHRHVNVLAPEISLSHFEGHDVCVDRNGLSADTLLFTVPNLDIVSWEITIFGSIVLQAGSQCSQVKVFRPIVSTSSKLGNLVELWIDILSD